ncbi:MAG TPA: hypothetical protein VI756_09395 [Blastocatellia bacterium]
MKRALMIILLILLLTGVASPQEARPDKTQGPVSIHAIMLQLIEAEQRYKSGPGKGSFGTIADLAVNTVRLGPDLSIPHPTMRFTQRTKRVSGRAGLIRLSNNPGSPGVITITEPEQWSSPIGHPSSYLPVGRIVEGPLYF